MDGTRVMPKDEVERVLHRAGLSRERVHEIAADLPDLVDLDRDAAVFDRHGINRGHLTEMLGGSP